MESMTESIVEPVTGLLAVLIAAVLSVAWQFALPRCIMCRATARQGYKQSPGE